MNPTPMSAADVKAPARHERFEVVLLDRKRSIIDAMPDDFRRVAVLAPSPYEARQHADVTKWAEGWAVIAVTKEHVLTEEEQQAQRRAQNTPVDRSMPPEHK